VPTDVVVAFNELLGRQGLTALQLQTANERITDIRAYFAASLQMQQPVFTIGSANRGTMVAGERDIDLMAVVTDFYANQYRTDSRQFLYDVRTLLARRYPRTDVGARQLAVVLDFNVIRTEVVPAFTRNPNGYWIANGRQGWKGTNPPYHAQLVGQADALHGQRLKPLVRLIKAWNVVHALRLRSFHLEMLVKRMWDGNAIGVWPAAVAGTLRVLGGWVNQSFTDPWDNVTRIDDYLSANERAQAVRTINESAAAATTAEQHRLAGRIPAAFERWQVVYRHTFPAYG